VSTRWIFNLLYPTDVQIAEIVNTIRNNKSWVYVMIISPSFFYLASSKYFFNCKLANCKYESKSVERTFAKKIYMMKLACGVGMKLMMDNISFRIFYDKSIKLLIKYL
jgi:hypothetical protein